MTKNDIKNHIQNILNNKKQEIKDKILPNAQNAAFNKYSMACVTSIAIDIRNYKNIMKNYKRWAVINLLQAFTSSIIKIGKENYNFISAYTNGDEVIMNFNAKTVNNIDENVITAIKVNSVINYLLKEELNSFGYEDINFKAGIGLWTSFDNSLVRYGEKGSQEESYHTVIGDSMNNSTQLAKIANKNGNSPIIFNNLTFNNLTDERYKNWAKQLWSSKIDDESLYNFDVYDSSLI